MAEMVPESKPVTHWERYSRPTLFAYQEALKESDESFEALLNQHEPGLAATGAPSETVTVSSLSPGLFKDLLGDR